MSVAVGHCGPTSDGPQTAQTFRPPVPRASVGPLTAARWHLSLFPRLYPDGGSSAARQRLTESQGVGNRDYFDRYFNFGVPDDDISDVSLQQYINAIEGSNETASISIIRDALLNDTQRTCRKMQSLLAGKLIASAALLPVLAEAYAVADHEIFSVDGSALLHVEQLASLAIAEMEPENLEETVTAVNGQASGAIMLSSALSTMKARETPVQPALIACIARILEERVEALMRRPLTEASSHDFRHVYHWRVTAGKDVADPRLKQVLLDGRWGALDFAARSVGVVVSGRAESLPELHFDVLDEVIGLDYFYAELETLMSEDIPLPRMHHYADTIENRRIMALGQLKQRRDRDRATPEG